MTMLIIINILLFSPDKARGISHAPVVVCAPVGSSKMAAIHSRKSAMGKGIRELERKRKGKWRLNNNNKHYTIILKENKWIMH